MYSWSCSREGVTRGLGCEGAGRAPGVGVRGLSWRGDREFIRAGRGSGRGSGAAESRECSRQTRSGARQGTRQAVGGVGAASSLSSKSVFESTKVFK